MMSEVLSDEKIEQVLSHTPSGQIYRSVIHDIEKDLIEKDLVYSSGNQLLASRFLGLNRNTLRTKIKRLQISVEQFKL